MPGDLIRARKMLSNNLSQIDGAYKWEKYFWLDQNDTSKIGNDSVKFDCTVYIDKVNLDDFLKKFINLSAYNSLSSNTNPDGRIWQKHGEILPNDLTQTFSKTISNSRLNANKRMLQRLEVFELGICINDDIQKKYNGKFANSNIEIKFGYKNGNNQFTTVPSHSNKLVHEYTINIHIVENTKNQSVSANKAFTSAIKKINEFFQSYENIKELSNLSLSIVDSEKTDFRFFDKSNNFFGLNKHKRSSFEIVDAMALLDQFHNN